MQEVIKRKGAKELYASVSSRSRRTVLKTRSMIRPASIIYKMFTHLRTVAAAVVETVHAPPAIVFLQALQCQIPTAVLFTESYRNQQRQLFPMQFPNKDYLSAESASVSRVLRDFHLFDLLTQRSTITLDIQMN
jgi:hypothetical protein